MTEICSSCGQPVPPGASPWCDHRPLDGTHGVKEPGPGALLSPVSSLRLLIRDRGFDPNHFAIWQQGDNVLCVAVRPEARAGRARAAGLVSRILDSTIGITTVNSPWIPSPDLLREMLLLQAQQDHARRLGQVLGEQITAKSEWNSAAVNHLALFGEMPLQ